MPSARRFVAGFAALLLVFAAAAPAVAACAGWSIAPGDRHACACCAQLGELASEGSVTDCCAASEQSSGPVDRDNQLPDAVPPADSPTGVLLAPSPELGVPSGNRIPLQAASPPKYVLLGSFLI